MKRECFLYRSAKNASKHFYIDRQNAKEIFEFRKNNAKKFDYIVNYVLNQNHIYYDDYVSLDKEAGTSEMRFLSGTNGRIYCRELKEQGKFIIVMAKVEVSKKSMKINKSILAKIEVIKNYEYEF